MNDLVVIGDKSQMTPAEFREARRTYLGGSDAGALMGVSPYASPLAVYTAKMGLFKPDASEIMEWGNILEPVIREEFARRLQEESGRPVRIEDDPLLYRSETKPWLGGTVDGLIIWEDTGEVEGLEIKTASEFLAKAWAYNAIPPQYYAQVQHYMALRGWPRVRVACLLGRKLVTRLVERAVDYIANMVDEVERRFWNDYVVPEVMPAPSGMEIDDKILAKLYGGEVEEERIAEIPHKLDAELDVLAELEADQKELKVAIAAVKQRVRQELGECKYGEGERHKVTWSRWESHRFDQKRFAVEHPMLYEEYKTKVTPGQRLTVKLKGDKDA